MDKRFDRLEKKVDALSERVDKLEERLDHIEVRMDKIEVSMDKLEERMGKIEVCMEKFESRMLEAIKELRAEVSNLRWWFLGSCLAMIAIAIAFAQFQTSWFQNGMVQHREATAQLIERMDRDARERDAKLSKAWERIEANQLRLERLDAQQVASTAQQP